MRVLKFFTILFLMGSFYVLSFFIGLFVYDEWKLKKIRTRLISQYSHWGLKVLGIEVQQSPSHPLISQNHFIVCNHLSYLDILILAAIHPCCFVTSREIQRTPVLGNLAEVGGCLFVDRQSKKNLELEITEITHALKNQLNVVVFPEATSTCGDEVLRFRRPLFNAAIYSKTSIVSYCINYQSIDGQLVSSQNRDQLFWYGDMEFLPHLWQLMGIKKIKVRVEGDRPLESHDRSDQELAQMTHQWVRDNFQALGV